MTERPVVILHFTPPGTVGGVEHVVEEHVRLLAKERYSVELVAGRQGPIGPLHVIPEILAAGPENSRIEDELAAGVVSPRFHRSREVILAALRPIVQRSGCLIVHNAFTLHFCLPLTAALWELAQSRPPDTIVAWCHDLSWTNPLYLPTMYDRYPWNLLRFPAPHVRYVTVSRERREELAGLWAPVERPIDVIPNGIDPVEFLRLGPAATAIEERFRLFDRDAVFLLPVRITRRKNIELGIRAMQRLKSDGLDVLFLVSGPQAPHHPDRSQGYLNELKTLRAGLELDDQVVFLADALGQNLDDDTVVQLYALCDALLFPSSQEGFGLPILEAGLARVPAIVSDIPIFGEVGGEDVWTFGLDEAVDRIAGALRSALDGRPSRLYRRVLREYRWDAILNRRLLPLLEHSFSASYLPHDDIGLSLD